MLTSWHAFFNDFTDQLPLVISGLEATLKLALVASITGFVWGIVIFGLSLSPSFWVRKLTKAYMEFFIGTPLIMILFLIYFGLPQTGVHLTSYQVAVVGFTLNIGAYNAAYLTSAYNALGRHEIEAAMTQGFSQFKILRYIILPQAIAASIPALTNQVVNNVKDSTIAFLIQFTEFFARMQEVAASNFDFFRSYLFAGMVYIAINAIIILLSRCAESKMRATF